MVLPLLQSEVVPPGWVSNDAFLAGYGAAQAVPGVAGARSWALELAADGVRVNALAPGPTASEALAAAGGWSGRFVPERRSTARRQGGFR